MVSDELTLAQRYGHALLADMGIANRIRKHADHPALAWRRAGLMAVTGLPERSGLVCPSPLTSAADGAMMALAAIADPEAGLPPSGAVLLGERSRLLGLMRKGAISANGSCLLLDCLDGLVALNLPREDDWDLLPALLEEDPGRDPYLLKQIVSRRHAMSLVERGAELGMAIAQDLPPTAPPSWFKASGVRGRRVRHTPPRVIDLSSLWAGPLAGSLLSMVGAEVIKVESSKRPDGARFGPKCIFDLLNGSKTLVSLDFQAKADLLDLIDSADIVIEASRPRALRRLGVVAEHFVEKGGLWLSITGYGRQPPQADRIAFGDDAAVAAGLVSVMRNGWGHPVFAGDAIADPMTGIHAALAAWGFWSLGRAGLIEVSLAGTMAHALGLGMATGTQLTGWQAMAEGDDSLLYKLR